MSAAGKPIVTLADVRTFLGDLHRELERCCDRATLIGHAVRDAMREQGREYVFGEALTDLEHMIRRVQDLADHGAMRVGRGEPLVLDEGVQEAAE